MIDHNHFICHFIFGGHLLNIPQIKVTLSADFMTHFLVADQWPISKIVTENFPDFSVTI